MSFPTNYQRAMTELASLAEPDKPAYVRVKALTKLVHELSPGNPNQRAIHLALGLDPHPDTQTSHETEPAALPEGGRAPFTIVSEEDLPEEDDEYQ